MNILNLLEEFKNMEAPHLKQEKPRLYLLDNSLTGTSVVRIKNLSNIGRHDLSKWPLAVWLILICSASNCFLLLTRLWQLLIGALSTYNPMTWNPGINSLPFLLVLELDLVCFLLFHLSP